MKDKIYDLCLFLIICCLVASTFFLSSIAYKLSNLDSFVYINVDKLTSEVTLNKDDNEQSFS